MRDGHFVGEACEEDGGGAVVLAGELVGGGGGVDEAAWDVDGGGAVVAVVPAGTNTAVTVRTAGRGSTVQSGPETLAQLLHRLKA